MALPNLACPPLISQNLVKLLITITLIFALFVSIARHSLVIESYTISLTAYTSKEDIASPDELDSDPSLQAVSTPTLQHTVSTPAPAGTEGPFHTNRVPAVGASGHADPAADSVPQRPDPTPLDASEVAGDGIGTSGMLIDNSDFRDTRQSICSRDALWRCMRPAFCLNMDLRFASHVHTRNTRITPAGLRNKSATAANIVAEKLRGFPPVYVVTMNNPDRAVSLIRRLQTAELRVTLVEGREAAMGCYDF